MQHFVDQEQKARYANLAESFVESSGKDKYYIATYDECSDDGDGIPTVMVDDLDFYVKLTDEQLAEVRQAVEASKAEDIDLWEYYDGNEPEYLQQESRGRGVWYSFCKINLEDVHYRIDAKVAVFWNGIDAAPRVKKVGLILSAEEYVELLAWQLQNRNGNFNDLFNAKPELFSQLHGQLRGFFSTIDHISPLATPIFAVELTEMTEAAQTILGEKSVSGDFWFVDHDDVLEHNYVHIHERVLDVFYQRMRGEENHVETIDNVDAVAVEEMLGVDSYEGIVNWLESNCADSEGVKRFGEMLKVNNIKYDYRLVE